MKLISQGAEANLYLDKDRNVIIKDRLSKGYRTKELDELLRKTRTKKEAKLLSDASRSGIPVPGIVSKSPFVLELEYLNGPRIKDMINRSNYSGLSKTIGSSIGMLHKNRLIHGDLTTSNMIFYNDKVYFIDFGLGAHSSKVEDMAVDIHLLEQAVESTHSEIAQKVLKTIFNAYCKEFEDGEKVLERLAVIRKRGRYNIRNPDKSK